MTTNTNTKPTVGANDKQNTGGALRVRTAVKAGGVKMQDFHFVM